MPNRLNSSACSYAFRGVICGHSDGSHVAEMCTDCHFAGMPAGLSEHEADIRVMLIVAETDLASLAGRLAPSADAAERECGNDGEALERAAAQLAPLGLDRGTVRALVGAKVTTIVELVERPDWDLECYMGIGPARLRKIRAAADTWRENMRARA